MSNDRRNELERAKAILKQQGAPHKEVNREINKLKSDEELMTDIEFRRRRGLDPSDEQAELDSRR